MKKILFAIFAVAAAAVGCNNHRTVISGDVLGIEDGVIYLAESDRNGAVVDSTEIKGGKFVFNIDDAAQLLTLRTAEEGVAAVFTEDGNITVEGNLADNSVKAVGTPANEAFNAYNEAMMSINQRYAEAADTAAREAVYEEYQAFMDATKYLKMYKMTPIELAKTIINDIFKKSKLIAFFLL